MNEGGDEGGGMAASCIGLARVLDFVKKEGALKVEKGSVESKVALKVSQSISFGAAGGAIAHPIPHLILPP